MNYKIFFPTPLEEIEDIYNDNVDVCVQTESGKRYTFVVATVNNLRELCFMDKRGFVVPGSPVLIVEKLTFDIINALMEELLKDEKLAAVYGADLE